MIIIKYVFLKVVSLIDIIPVGETNDRIVTPRE